MIGSISSRLKPRHSHHRQNLATALAYADRVLRLRMVAVKNSRNRLLVVAPASAMRVEPCSYEIYREPKLTSQGRSLPHVANARNGSIKAIIGVNDRLGGSTGSPRFFANRAFKSRTSNLRPVSGE